MDSKLRGRCRMHKYVLIPDSFKGTLSARDFCAVAREAIGRADPGAQVLSIPLADGGEGTVEAFLAACGGVACRGREQGEGIAGDGANDG